MLSVINDSMQMSKPVDWWFMYKLPLDQKIPKTAQSSGAAPDLDGYNYLYVDSGKVGKMALSPHRLGQGAGALHSTLDHIFSAAEKPGNGSGWLLYNDEIPDSKDNDESKGHCKGILAFNKESDSGIWILHSTPRFPLVGNADFPDDERIYAQTYLAITLDSYTAANNIAAQLRSMQHPQIYAYKLPNTSNGYHLKDDIYHLCAGSETDAGAQTSQITFKSRGGVKFRSIAKSARWGKDFWIDLVGPALGADMKVESWRRGKIPGVTDSDPSLSVRDVGGIDLSPQGVPTGWHYTHDHSKWATSEEHASAGQPGWVCVADINRQVSQEKRGGGGICFREVELWRALGSIEVFT